jgi:hypothetical protein
VVALPENNLATNLKRILRISGVQMSLLRQAENAMSCGEKSAEQYPVGENYAFPVGPATAEKATAKLLFGMSKYQSLYETRIVVQSFPLCLHITNGMGQTPLHVAASKGVSCDALMFLMKNYPEACSLLDDYGRLPLHYVAMPSKWIIPAGCGYFGDTRDNYDTLDPQYLPMLKYVCGVYPGAAIQEDKEGLNPIEYGVMDSASNLLTVRSLHTAASWYWSDQKAKQNDACSIRHWEKKKEQVIPPSRNKLPVKQNDACSIRHWEKKKEQVIPPSRDKLPVTNKDLQVVEKNKEQGVPPSSVKLPVTSKDLQLEKNKEQGIPSSIVKQPVTNRELRAIASRSA